MQAHSFQSHLNHLDNEAKCDRLIQKVYRSKYNFFQCKCGEIVSIVERAIWGRVHREKLRPCCASEDLGWAKFAVKAGGVNVSSAAFSPMIPLMD